MSTFKSFATISGREIKVRSNSAKRHFTIITEAAKYRTVQLSKKEFDSCLNNTGNDWQQFLNSGDDYYKL